MKEIDLIPMLRVAIEQMASYYLDSGWDECEETLNNSWCYDLPSWLTDDGHNELEIRDHIIQCDASAGFLVSPVAIYYAMDSDSIYARKTLYISRHVKSKDFIFHMLAYLSVGDVRRTSVGRLTDKEWDNLSAALHRVYKCAYSFIHMKSVSVAYLRDWMRRVYVKSGLKPQIVIDDTLLLSNWSKKTEQAKQAVLDQIDDYADQYEATVYIVNPNLPAHQ